MSDLREQLREEQGEIAWKDLIPHALRDALIVVNPSLDLVTVGEAIANDQVNLVQNWIEAQLLGKPTAAELSSWNGSPERPFKALIVQPFVLVQLLS